MRKRESPPSTHTRATATSTAATPLTATAAAAVAAARRNRMSPAATVPEKQARSTSSKPLTPALSSNFRHVKNPLTPRLVGSAPSSPATSARNPPGVAARSPTRDSQVPASLNGNITPRSGARTSRIGTESPATPSAAKGVTNGTSRSRALSGGGNEHARPNGGLGPHILGMASPRLNSSTSALPKTPSHAPALTVHRRISAAKSMVETGRDREATPKFFHADVAKSPMTSPRMDPLASVATPRPPGLMGSPPPPLPVAGPHPSNNSHDPDEKFFRANDIPQNALPKKPLQPHIPLEKLTNLSLYPIDQVQETFHQPARATPPPSPKKAQSMFFPPKPGSPQKLPPNPPSPQLSRARIEWPRASPPAPPSWTAQQLGHRKSMSTSSIGTSIRRASISQPHPHPHQQDQPQQQQQQQQSVLETHQALTASPNLPITTYLSPETLSPRSISLASTNTVPTSVTSDTSSDLSKQALPPLGQPSHIEVAAEAPPPAVPQLDLAAQARRERKVLDLEISNSSLLAINKTLERELRKQNIELRRFRRLSRSGRLSLAPTNRVVSGQSVNSLGTVSEFDGEDDDLSEESDLDDEDIDDDEEGDSLLSNDSSRSRQRARDEKRLMLDLSKHQQLLIDSQNLSQSIRRCLTCTEELIRDGNKALEYRVGIGDVKLGGRVLNDDELDERGFDTGQDEVVARQGLLSPSIAKGEAQAWFGTEPPSRSGALSPSIAKSAAIEAQAWFGTEPLSIQSLNELSEMLEGAGSLP